MEHLYFFPYLSVGWLGLHNLSDVFIAATMRALLLLPNNKKGLESSTAIPVAGEHDPCSTSFEDCTTHT